jgi:hypothetical protein
VAVEPSNGVSLAFKSLRNQWFDNKHWFSDHLRIDARENRHPRLSGAFGFIILNCLFYLNIILSESICGNRVGMQSGGNASKPYPPID